MSCRRTASLPRTHTSGACPRSTGRNTAGRIESNNSRESILKHPFLGPHRNHTLVRIPEYLTLHRPVVSLLRLAGNECLFRFCSSVGLLVCCLGCVHRNRIAICCRYGNDRCAANIATETTVAEDSVGWDGFVCSLSRR